MGNMGGFGASPVPGQMPNQVPNQMPNQMPNQIPNQMPNSMSMGGQMGANPMGSNMGMMNGMGGMSQPTPGMQPMVNQVTNNVMGMAPMNAAPNNQQQAQQPNSLSTTANAMWVAIANTMYTDIGVLYE